MAIKYRFFTNGPIFECATFGDLEKIPNYHDIIWIDCSNNKLTVLPALPNSLIVLWCHNNQLRWLPTLPSNLTDLWCYSNNLRVLPNFPNKLTYLICYDNLPPLPDLPTSLPNIIYSNYDYVAVLPNLPTSLTHLDFSRPTKLPKLSKLQYSYDQV